MKLLENTRLIGDDEPRMRRIGVMDGSGVAEVKALGDLAMEVAEGDLAGRRIEAFAWLEHVGDSLVDLWEHQVNATEKRTGRRLARIPMLDASGKPLELTDELVEAMIPSMLKGACHAAFERFRNADDERLAEMFAYMDSVPSLPETEEPDDD